MSPRLDDAAEALFRDRILASRTVALAQRGSGPATGSGLLDQRLVCETRGRLFALELAAVEAIQPFRCHVVPMIAAAASGTMLGVFNQGGRLYSLVELAHLVVGGRDPPEPGGAMLLLRGAERALALRVDRVLGLLALRDAGDGRHALLTDPADDGALSDGRLVMLTDHRAIRDAILMLDASSSDPTGA